MTCATNLIYLYTALGQAVRIASKEFLQKKLKMIDDILISAGNY